MNKLSGALNSLNYRIITILIAVGIFLRLLFLAINPSLWADEAQISLFISDLKLKDILTPINAPIGFLLSQKIFTALFGFSEIALRFLPLLFGLSSIYLLLRISQKLFSSFGVIILLALFCFSDKQITYAVEAKQYTTDLFFALFLLWRALTVNEKTKKDFFITLSSFLIASWWSHPSCFVIPTIIIFKMISDRAHCKPWLMTGSIYTFNFGIYLALNLLQLKSSPFLQTYWVNYFLPLPTWDNLPWFIRQFEMLEKLTQPFRKTWILATLLPIGLFHLARMQKSYLVLFTLPFLLCALASTFKAYPIAERMLFFISPFLLILLVAGIERLLLLITHKYNLRLITTLIITLLIIQFSYKRIWSLAQGTLPEGNREIMQELSTETTDSDLMIVAAGMDIFNFYQKRYPVSYADLSFYSNDKIRLPKNLNLTNKPVRVWVVSLPMAKNKYHVDKFNRSEKLAFSKRHQTCWQKYGAKRLRAKRFGWPELLLFDLQGLSDSRIDQIQTCLFPAKRLSVK